MPRTRECEQSGNLGLEHVNKGRHLVGNIVFWSSHIRHNGDVYCILFLDKFPVHKETNEDEFWRANGIIEKIVTI